MNEQIFQKAEENISPEIKQMVKETFDQIDKNDFFTCEFCSRTCDISSKSKGEGDVCIECAKDEPLLTKEIELNYVLSVPESETADTVLHKFIEFVESNGWRAGGGIKDVSNELQDLIEAPGF